MSLLLGLLGISGHQADISIRSTDVPLLGLKRTSAIDEPPRTKVHGGGGVAVDMGRAGDREAELGERTDGAACQCSVEA